MTESTTKPSVWIIDSQQWPRALLRAELIERGLDAVGFASLDQAFLVIGRPGYPRPQLVILELNGLDDTPIKRKALSRLGVPIVLLGRNTELNQEWVKEGDWAAVVRRPYTIGTVADTVEGLVQSGSSHQERGTGRPRP